jgi:GNAT superfamily N-acetyltransferase
MDATDFEIREARSETEEADAAELMAAYLKWGTQQLREHYGVDDAPADPSHVRAGLDSYRAPSGCLLVAYSAGRPVGVGALRQLPGGAAEIKRMFVIPEARSLGIGSRLLDRLLESAAETGATTVLLDTAGNPVHVFTPSRLGSVRAMTFFSLPPEQPSDDRPEKLPGATGDRCRVPAISGTGGVARRRANAREGAWESRFLRKGPDR